MYVCVPRLLLISYLPDIGGVFVSLGAALSEVDDGRSGGGEEVFFSRSSSISESPFASSDTMEP